ncbi:hypothetical protein [Streptomyces recifensis]|uniref:hypothetical protein n=1 Tax=Streptomyces recifensis TaxID=67355 RepID=UPI003CC5C566
MCAVRDEQLLGQEFVEGGAEVGRIGLEGALDLGDEIVRRLRGVCGASAVRAARRTTCCWNVMPCCARTCSRTPRAA